MNERLQEMSRYVEQDDQFPIRLRDGIGNSTLTGILTDLQTDHTLGDNNSIGAISRFLGCFEPIADPSTNHLESLWDQTATAVMAYRHLPQEDQEQINGMMDTLLWSLANTPQERKVNGHTKDISPHVRELAETIGLETDTWKHVTEPTNYAKQGKLRMHPKLAIASALVAVSIIAACTPVRPTITPEATTPAALTQPVQTTEAPLRQGDPGYEVIPIPGQDILEVLGPKSMYTRPIGDGYYELAGYPVKQGTDPNGNYYIVWTGFDCSGKGCPQTLVISGPSGTPTSQSCINGFEVRNTINPNYDPTNPHSKPIEPRYYATGNNNQCSTLSTTSNTTSKGSR